MSWRTPVTLIVLLAFVCGAGWYGWRQFRAPIDSNDDPSCVEAKLAKGSRLKARQVTVNVYNAGTREGLAGETLDKMQQRDFRTGEADNAPSRIRVDEVAIYDARPRSSEVTLVRRQLAGPVRVIAKRDIAAGVDVVVGSDFKGMVQGAPTSVRLSRSELACVPEGRSGGG